MVRHADEPVRVYVGTDRSQFLAVKVLEHSIKRHTDRDVVVTPMIDMPVPEPVDPMNRQRTGFSFSRFCIPKLAGYRGKALYLDADMLVFQDIERLWTIPFDGAKVVIQAEVKHQSVTTRKVGAPRERPKQCSVMLLDCERLDWDIERIVQGLDRGDYGYGQLMYQLCLLKEEEIKYGVPFEWNSLEFYDAETCLIHYTDMATQPWVSCRNKLGYLWLQEIKHMLDDGSLTIEELESEIRLGFFRPSLVWDARYRHAVPRALWPICDMLNGYRDSLRRFRPHRSVYEAKRRRLTVEASSAMWNVPPQKN
jgi:hypothetical protein